MTENNDFIIEDELKKLPAKPGVYLMHGENDEIIYIGKAIKLSNRVKSYFRKSKKSVKTYSMISHIKRFEYIVTDSEIEALILECNLIKEHHPKYNIMLMDDKAYPYIKVSVSEDFPRVTLARKIGKDKNTNKYFGPYTSNMAVKETIDLLHKIYLIRTCNKKLPEDIGKTRPCLNYHIGRCKAPCSGLITSDEYKKQIDKVINFLNGNFNPVIKELKEKMEMASNNLEFEEAITYRELLDSVNHIAQKQKISGSEYKDRDIIGIDLSESDSVVQVFFIRNGRMIGRDHFYLSRPKGETKKEIILEFLKQFYGGTPYIPREIMLPVEIDEGEEITNWLTYLKGDKVTLVIPKIGKKEKLVELACKNAKMVLEQDRSRLIRERNRTVNAVKEIEKIIGLENINRIEAYDISNISGVNSVGSMVVFEGGKSKPSDYRKFNIKTVIGSDDYKSLSEVLNRRFEHGIREKKEQAYSSFTKFPDLIMMDGGKGQVKIAKDVLKRLGINIPVCGMVKDDNHRTRGLYFNNKELDIDTHSEGFKLITRIQDEAHRFAITSHRLKRGKEQIHSVLDDIEGIGPVRRKALRRELGSIDKIRDASIEVLESIPEISKNQAEIIFKFFHKNK